MTRRKFSTTVYLTTDQIKALRELHEKTRVPMAEYIRLGIDLVLANPPLSRSLTGTAWRP